MVPKAISYVFDRTVDIYQTALKDSGFDGIIIYIDQTEQAKNVNVANQARKSKCLVQPALLYECENECR